MLAETAAPIVPPTAEPIVESTTPKVDTALPADAATEELKTTTGIRSPLVVPSSVHVSIGSENLLDYIGPPVYQKDRLYTKTSPVGVSCGLGYLGNGSGATMPIEVSVSQAFTLPSTGS